MPRAISAFTSASISFTSQPSTVCGEGWWSLIGVMRSMTPFRSNTAGKASSPVCVKPRVSE